ncbi:lysophospholipid acyltransferase family protein [bacterium]|nr:lysophospholipid acyltransferase family protein [bacterium]
MNLTCDPAACPKFGGCLGFSMEALKRSLFENINGLFDFCLDLNEYLFWRLTQFFVPLAPVSLLYYVSGILGRMLYFTGRKRRRQTEYALKRFPGLSLSGDYLRRIVKESFIENCRFQMETLLYPHLNKRNIEEMTAIAGIDRLKRVLEDGKGAILLLSHFGNNEIIMPALGYRGFRISQIADRHPPGDLKDAARPTSPLRIRNMSMRFNRQDALPCRFIPARGPARDAVRTLRDNGILMVTGDGRIGKRFMEFPFLGLMARFLTGPVKMGIRNGSPIFPVFTLRNKDNTSRIVIMNRIDMDGDVDSTEEARIRGCLSAYVAALEGYIKRYPANYAKYLWQMSLGVRKGDIPMFIEEDGIK